MCNISAFAHTLRVDRENVELLHVDDPLQRTFYAVEAMRGPWSVRELQRQIDTNIMNVAVGARSPNCWPSG